MFLARLMAAGFHNIVGVDTSEEQVARARSRGIASATQGDVFETLQQFEARAANAVVAIDLIEHLTKQEAMLLADEVLRVLAPGGIWIIHTVNGESPFFGRIRFGDFTHETTFTQQSIRQMLQGVGFASVESFEDSPIVHGAKSLGRAAIWSAFRGIVRLIIAAETGDMDSHAILSQNFLTVALKANE